MKSISKQLICICIILLLVGVSYTSAIRVENKPHIVNNQIEEDCDFNNSNFNVDYPPIICSVLFAMIHVIDTTIDVIGILLIYFGHTLDEVIKMLSPFIDFSDFLLELWGELNCPSCYP